MNTQIYEEASDWLVRNREGDLDAQEKTRFDAWLRESPQHVRAYLEISTVWEDVASLDPSLNAGAEDLIARARAEDNIVPLGLGEASPRKRTTPILGKVGLFYALAASVLLTLAGIWLYSQRNTYSTDVGEQRSIVLNDGSTIELNSRSRVRVRFSDAERDVDLIEGQALFRVAKNSLRPFIVSADGTHVRAVGTQFDVYKMDSGVTVVTVVEGRVAVSATALAAPQAISAGVTQNSAPSFLTAGEQVIVTAQSPAHAQPKAALRPSCMPERSAARPGQRPCSRARRVGLSAWRVCQLFSPARMFSR